jgi:hypothetical protein
MFFGHEAKRRYWKVERIWQPGSVSEILFAIVPFQSITLIWCLFSSSMLVLQLLAVLPVPTPPHSTPPAPQELLITS